MVATHIPLTYHSVCWWYAGVTPDRCSGYVRRLYVSAHQLDWARAQGQRLWGEGFVPKQPRHLQDRQEREPVLAVHAGRGR